MPFHLKPFKSSFIFILKLKCAFASPHHSNQALSIQNLSFEPQTKYSQTQIVNTHKCAQLHPTTSNLSFSIQMTLIPSNIHNLHSTTSNEVIFNSNDLNTYKCIQLH
jgi:hypothetical protein